MLMKSRLQLGCVLAFGLGSVVFALTAHRPPWIILRGMSLVLATIAVAVGWSCMVDPIRTTFGRFRHRAAGLKSLVVVGAGIVVAVLYRTFLGTSPLPAALTWFAVPAAGIGATEEILWRGWMQGSLAATLGPWRAAMVSAGAHAAYKSALFAFPPANVVGHRPEVILGIGVLTFCFGVALGGFRAREGSVIPPILAHAVFDVLVYGDQPAAPWWVG